MARGNQRDKSREKAQKVEAGKKKGNTQSGTEYLRTKEAQAAIMLEKQRAAEEKKAAEAAAAGPSAAPSKVKKFDPLA